MVLRWLPQVYLSIENRKLVRRTGLSSEIAKKTGFLGFFTQDFGQELWENWIFGLIAWNPIGDSCGDASVMF